MVSLLGKVLLEAVIYCSAALTSGRCAVALVPVPLTGMCQWLWDHCLSEL